MAKEQEGKGGSFYENAFLDQIAERHGLLHTTFEERKPFFKSLDQLAADQEKIDRERANLLGQDRTPAEIYKDMLAERRRMQNRPDSMAAD